MAVLIKDDRSPNWVIQFQWAGRRFSRSTKITTRRSADAIKGRVEETLRMLEQGQLVIPHDADPGAWILSGGKAPLKPPVAAKSGTLATICDLYTDEQLDKADSTLGTERTHIRHIKQLLGESASMQKLKNADLQKYVDRRMRQSHRGKRTSGPTVRKELHTFSQVWDWARLNGFVQTECPIRDENRRWALKIPKLMEKPKFQTWTQIERRIRRGGLSEEQEQELWASLFLDEDQISDLLKFVKKQASHPFIYPMFVFTAYSGARRGEIFRSEIEDFDFDANQIVIRERKRRKDMQQTFRFVPLHPRLQTVMDAWFNEHPGGPFTIAAPLKMARRATHTEFCKMGPYAAHHHFKQTLRGRKWEVVRGFHVLRHSFASNLARSGKVSRDTIGEWMGHTTDEMKNLYQHLFPQDGQTQISVLK